MARQINDTLELDNENSRLREVLYGLKEKIRTIQEEHTEVLDLPDTNDLSEELDTMYLTIENALYYD